MDNDKAAALLRTVEGNRLLAIERGAGWRRWGPYVSERQWGTVREDYSPYGNAWEYFPHDHARSRAYRWGEDGIAGFGDERLRWCLGLALWNERDPILKERLFGLTNSEGNHGEDVKEHYAYIDATPTHSYNRMTYRYPQAAFPYEMLLAENRKRGAGVPEFEIYDTGVFDNCAFFDITVEYAKADTDDILMRVTAQNCGQAAAPLHLVPQFWSRNTWSWSATNNRPRIRRLRDGGLLAVHTGMQDMRLDIDQEAAALFCENETNVRRLFGMPGQGPFKDGINDAIVQGDHAAVSLQEGSKAGLQHRVLLPPGGQATLRLRLRPAEIPASAPFTDFDKIMAHRIQEADEFYAALQPAATDAECDMIRRKALAGLLWSKQFYHLDIPRWLDGDPAQPKPPATRTRNEHWRHLNNADIIAMPDKWEYPWYAAWDLGFHCVALAKIDPEFAKGQLVLLTREWYMHPNGQLPAYEWAFGDVNPPVHAYAAWRVYLADARLRGKPDHVFLARIFHKLLINFTWWVNRKDSDGRNVFQGGFLGLDNIGIFDRSKPLPVGGSIDQADGTAWMAMYALNMMRIAIELAGTEPVYQDLASKFFEHFLAIAAAMTDIGGRGNGLWDEKEGFFYDILALPDGRHIKMRLRSIVGLIPMFAVEVLDSEVFDRLPEFAARTRWFLQHRPDLAGLVSHWTEPGKGDRRLLSLLRGHRLKCLLRWMLNEAEFLSPYGVRSLSRAYTTPYMLEVDGQRFEIGYEPGESSGGSYGGNSNWRGPIWFPINFMLVESLRSFHLYYGEDFKVECPVGSGSLLCLREVADYLTERLTRLFRRGADGKRPFCGTGPGACTQSDDALFHEYFHGETGKGLGAAHQTGWTALVACLLGE
jgi:hypothetical protein